MWPLATFKSKPSGANIVQPTPWQGHGKMELLPLGFASRRILAQVQNVQNAASVQ
jgi:hypothetical protein